MRAVSTMSRIRASSLPMTASISLSPDRKIRLSWSYQRISSCVL